jgi:hypothetical protein
MILIYDPLVSLILEPHLVYSLLYYGVVVYTFSLAIVVGKNLKTE